MTMSAFAGFTSGVGPYQGIKDHLWETLRNMGARVADYSINRVDFAMDFQTSGFELELENFVSHRRSIVEPYWGQAVTTSDAYQSPRK